MSFRLVGGGAYSSAGDSQRILSPTDRVKFWSDNFTVRFARVDWKVHRLKRSYDDIISAVDDSLDQWDLSIATQMEEVYAPQRRLFWKINPIRSYFMTESWSTEELFSWLSYVIYQVCVRQATPQTNKIRMNKHRSQKALPTRREGFFSGVSWL